LERSKELHGARRRRWRRAPQDAQKQAGLRHAADGPFLAGILLGGDFPRDIFCQWGKPPFDHEEEIG
jgi:hypothetical protein